MGRKAGAGQYEKTRRHRLLLGRAPDLALRHPQSAGEAAAAWYGPVAGNTDELHPKRVMDLLPDLKVPLLGLYAAADQGIAVADVAKVRDEAKRLHKAVEIVIYPDTPHGFNADYRPSYRPDAAKDGWKRMLAWFKSHGA
ncbi:MAG TPA: dienelactone hydrolase family protein [Stellaceae bacterium]|nr:dienelactone hydrolase family protein [Stellaceae bacterium]